jgi:hypothetical protein
MMLIFHGLLPNHSLTTLRPLHKPHPMEFTFHYVNLAAEFSSVFSPFNKEDYLEPLSLETVLLLTTLVIEPITTSSSTALFVWMSVIAFLI